MKEKLNTVIQVSFCLSAMFACQYSYADEVNVSTTNQNSLMKTLSEKAVLSLWSYYRGGPLSDLGNGYQPDEFGALDTSSSQSIENLVTTGYRLNKDVAMTAAAHFYYFPDSTQNALGQSFKMYDPILAIAHSNLYNSGGFNLSGKFVGTLPLTKSDLSDRQGDITVLSTVLTMNYDVPKTRLTVGLFNQFFVYIGGPDQISNARTYKLYSAPYAEYQLSKRVSLTMWVDLMQATRNKDVGFLTGMDNPAMDIEPGVRIALTDKISINPIINFYPKTPTLAASSLQATLTAKAF